MKTINQKRFDEAYSKMTELIQKYPKLLTIITISDYMKRINDPLSPIYDYESSYKEHLEELEKFLE